MKVGIALPQMIPNVTPDTIARFAQTAEALGYDSLWVNERLMWPLKPREPYSDTPDGSLPEPYKYILDAIETLTFVAPLTRRVQLGTSILVAPYHGPVMLARRLATLDILSGGRLICGIGIGWSSDEYEALGMSKKGLEARMVEVIQGLIAVWTQDAVEFKGHYYQIAPSVIGPKPIQKPYPPIYQAAFTEKAMRRAALYCDGWNPPNPASWEEFDRNWKFIRDTAREAGRNPDALSIILRAHVDLKNAPRAASGHLFSGTLEQIRTDTRAARDHGVAHTFYELGFTPEMTESKMFDQMKLLRDAAG
jgi:probable F420-dependent oxidoreductase